MSEQTQPPFAIPPALEVPQVVVPPTLPVDEGPKVRNARYVSADNGAINCEINHPTLGWIPNTAMPGSTYWERLINEVDCVVDEYVPPPAPTAEEQAAAAQAERVAKYLRRAQSAPRLVAEFAAENEVRLASGQWTLSQLQSVIGDPNVATLIRLLQSASYESALALVQSLNGGVYTADLKASWITKIRGAM